MGERYIAEHASYTRHILYTLNFERLVHVQTTPNTPSRLCCTLDGAPLERFDLGTGGVKKELNFVGNAIDLKTVEGDDFVPIVHWDDGNVSLAVV